MTSLGNLQNKSLCNKQKLQNFIFRVENMEGDFEKVVQLLKTRREDFNMTS
jgi:hypothetical protein